MSGAVLVTGAAGFVGRAAVRALAERGFPVRAGYRASVSPVRPLGVTAVAADVLDPTSLPPAMEGVRTVVHCAVGDPRDTSVIVQGTRNVLRAARAVGVEQLIHLSSVAVYGEAPEGIVDEDAPTDAPHGHYGAAKVEAEAICRAAAEGMAVAILRPSLIYGPASALWVTPYLERLKTGRWPALGPGGEGTCNLIHVDDLAGFITHLAANPQPGVRTFNVNGADVPSWNSYIARLALATGTALAPPAPPPGRMKLAARKAAKAATMLIGKGGMHLEALDRFVLLTPSHDELVRFRGTARYAIDRMVATGFTPRIDVNVGVAGVAAWDRAGRPGL